MLTAEKPDDYVLATGTTYSIREFVNFTANAAGIEIEWDGEGVDEVARNCADGKVIVNINKDYFRPAEVSALIGDPSKAAKDLGWVAKTQTPELAKLMFEKDLEKVSSNTVHF